MGSARQELEQIVGATSARITPLATGRTGPVVAVEQDAAPRRVAKLDDSGRGGLDVEAAMLRFAGPRADVPFPGVEYASPRVLLMPWHPGDTGVRDAAADDAAAALARLHAVSAKRYGFDDETRIGGLALPNPWRDAWLPFFAEARLIAFAEAAHGEGQLDADSVGDIERVAARLDVLASEPARPALLHGDLWSGNVLSEGDRLTALLDPALYFGHPEVDLAFATMFGGFPRRFFDAYRERAGGDVGDGEFWSARRDLWNLFPLLVHVRLFGGGYVDELRRTARRFA